MMIKNQKIEVKKENHCPICGKKGVVLYKNMRDGLFKTPGLWNFIQCPECGLIWINPQPLPEEIKKLYAHYYTHSKDTRTPKIYSLRKKIKNSVLAGVFGYKNLSNSKTALIMGKVLGRIPPVRRTVEIGIRGLKAAERGVLLDIGCGNGKFLAMMRGLGWEVLGIEPDPEAAKIAREHFGVKVISNNLMKADLSSNSMDAITISHVLEHVLSPVELLRECRRILKPEGRLVIIVPNSKSLGHKIFKKSWLNLDPPRHFFVFSLQSLKFCAEQAGLCVKHLQTLTRMASWTWISSKNIQLKGEYPEENIGIWQKIAGRLFQLTEQIIWNFWKEAGEEIILTACKKKV